ncbi:MAG: DUF1320 domain-containing protein [Proteobacteria bacterium]|nr:DUF1320 domain-containing protein [Pseudomonadota bacterium]
MYVTLQQLAESPGATELAQVASASFGPIVDPPLLDATLRGTDRSAWPVDAIAAADDAAARIGNEIVNAGNLIDGYLARRYALPLDPVPALLGTWAIAIVRYRLNKDRVSNDKTDPVVRDYQEAMGFLNAIAAGKFSLGPVDPTLQPPAIGETSIDPGRKVWGLDVRGNGIDDPYGAGRGF